MNRWFRCTSNRTLDRLYLRTCAIYRLLKAGRIDRDEALALQNHRYAAPDEESGRRHPPRDYLTATISIWLSGPLSEKGRANQIAWHTA